MLDLSDMGEEDVSRAVSSEFKRIVEDDVDLPFLVDSLVVDGRALQVIWPICAFLHYSVIHLLVADVLCVFFVDHARS